VPYFAGPVADERDALLTLLFHLIQESARHAGHANIIRETLDGRRAGQLLDAYEAG
jgi:hypothetical protein